MLEKDKLNREIEFPPAYFNSTTKPVINFKYDLDKSFQEVLYRIDKLNKLNYPLYISVQKFENCMDY